MLYVLSVIAVVIGVALDQFTKYLATSHLKDNPPIVLIDGVFKLQYLENEGAAFGILQNQQWLFVIIASIALILITIIYIRMPRAKRFIPFRISLVAIVAGAIGNMIDRVANQYVVDFFYFELIDFPIFNVADIYATVSTFALIFLFLFYYKEKDFDLIFSSLKLKKKEK